MGKCNPRPVFRDTGDDENRFFLRRIGIKPGGVVCNSEFLQQKALVCDLQTRTGFQSHLHLFLEKTDGALIKRS